MSRLDDYRTAMLAANDEIDGDKLTAALDAHNEDFVSLVVDHGLGPLWHERTGREEFHESRMAAEALFLAQQIALSEVDNVLVASDIDYAVIKGAANRERLYANPALRACHDLDILVNPEDKLSAARALAGVGFAPFPEARSISREIVMAGNGVDIDLHWSLLREGRLRQDVTAGVLDRRQRVADMWALGADDTLFALLVHPAFAKHLAGWQMGLHRVVDLLEFLRTQDYDWPAVRALLRANGVSTAAWATLRWAEILANPHVPDVLPMMKADLQPGPLRRAWLDRWLHHNLSERLSGSHRARLLGFSWLLHDTMSDALRALRGKRRAARRSGEDLAAFSGLLGE